MIIILIIAMIATVFVVVLLFLDFRKEGLRKEIERIELKRLQEIIDKKHWNMRMRAFHRQMDTRSL